MTCCMIRVRAATLSYSLLFVGVLFSTVTVNSVAQTVAFILFGARNYCRLFASQNRFATQVILKSWGREYGDYAGGFCAGILQADPRTLRNEHHSSRMQIALLISNVNVCHQSSETVFF
jgi:hypothetical protein